MVGVFLPRRSSHFSRRPLVGSRGPNGRRGSARWPHVGSAAAPCGATSSSSTSSAMPARRAVTVGAGSVVKTRWPQMGAIAPHAAASVGVPHMGAASAGVPHVGAAPQGVSKRGTRPRLAALSRPRGRPCWFWRRPSSTASPSSSATRSWASPGPASSPSHPERHPRGHHGPAVGVPA